MRLYTITSTVMLLAVLFAGSAQAFKIGTHVWLADEIATEVAATGKVTLLREDGTVFATLPVDAQLRDSIKNYSAAFVMGVLGPDIYPDLVAGQMTTHPGLPLKAEESELPNEVQSLMTALGLNFRADRPGWQTDDWLHHVRKEAYRASRGAPSAELAFAFGYQLHAAMDTWAHSYVNLITGDLFSIATNQTIAGRHAALEGFIGEIHKPYQAKRQLPPPTQRGSAISLLKLISGQQPVRSEGADDYARLGAPVPFVRRTLFLNADTAEQHARDPAAMHIWGMWALWESSRKLRRNLRPIKGKLDRGVDAAIAQVENAQLAWDAANLAKGQAINAANTAYSAFQAAESVAERAADGLLDAKQQAQQFARDNPAVSGLLNAADGAIEAILNWLPGDLSRTYNAAKTAAINADNSLRVARNRYERLRRQRDDAVANLSEKASDLDVKRQTVAAIRAARDQSWRVVNGAVIGWQRNIEAAVDAYIEAYEETAREIMRPHGNRFNPGGSVTWPVTAWATCWGPAFGMPPIPGLNNACQQHLTDFTQARQRITSIINNTLIPDALKPLLLRFDERLHDIQVAALPQIGALIRKGIPAEEGAVVPGSAAFMAVLWDSEIRPQDLRAHYETDASEQNLPLYSQSQMLTLLKKDGLPLLDKDGLPLRRLPNNGTELGKASYNDMLQFTPIRNAVTLSKLTLLSGTALNSLARRGGITASIYSRENRGAPMINEQALPGEILMGAIRSIDGNHQWLSVAPKLPIANRRARSAVRATSEFCRRFGYPSAADYALSPDLRSRCSDHEPYRSTRFAYPRRGFRLWQDPGLRKEVFNCIFRGPLSRGVCDLQGGNADASLGCGMDPYPAAFTLATQQALGAVATSGKGRAIAQQKALAAQQPSECLGAASTLPQRVRLKSRPQPKRQVRKGQVPKVQTKTMTKRQRKQ